MTERLLNLSGIERKEYPLTTIRLDLLLFECIAEQKLFLSKRGLSLHTAVTPNLEIMGNAELVTELFSNLLSNAVKYAASGTVNAELVKNEGQCCFRITNDLGNDDLDTERIWEPFYVGEPSRNKALSGTGLGLPIVKKIADKFGYQVRCIREDQTITFEVIF